MEARAPCTTLITVLLTAHVHLSYGEKTVFPRVIPDSQQHFEYQSVVISCEGLQGLDGWRVMKRIKGNVTTCDWKTGRCEIRNTFSVDSGEYWCEHGDLKRSNKATITVTAGSVILESPVHPAELGEALTLRCRNRMSSSIPTADFYKDGLLINSSFTGEITIRDVSKYDEGFYKCHVAGAGESPESWMCVTASEQQEDPHPVLSCSHHGFLALRIVGTILLLALGLAMVLLHRNKERCRSCLSLLPRLPFSKKQMRTAESPDGHMEEGL